MTTYDDYRKIVEGIASMVEEKQISEKRIRDRLSEAGSAAHDLPRLAVRQTDTARKHIEQQQSGGRSALGKIDQESLLPARVRPGRSIGNTSGPELDRLVAQHGEAVRRLQGAVANYDAAVRRESTLRQQQAQQEAAEQRRLRAQAEAERRRKEEAARVASAEAARRRRRAIQLVVGGFAVVAALIIVLVGIL